MLGFLYGRRLGLPSKPLMASTHPCHWLRLASPLLLLLLSGRTSAVRGVMMKSTSDKEEADEDEARGVATYESSPSTASL